MCNLLLIDDDPDILELLNDEFLSVAKSYSCLDVKSACSILDLARLQSKGWKPDLVLSDFNINKRYNIRDFCQAVKGINDVPMILLTANFFTVDQIRDLKTNLNLYDVIYKPFDFDTLPDIVLQTLSEIKPAS